MALTFLHTYRYLLTGLLMVESPLAGLSARNERQAEACDSRLAAAQKPVSVSRRRNRRPAPRASRASAPSVTVHSKPWRRLRRTGGRRPADGFRSMVWSRRHPTACTLRSHGLCFPSLDPAEPGGALSRAHCLALWPRRGPPRA
jgi:hypothetical protein